MGDRVQLSELGRRFYTLRPGVAVITALHPTELQCIVTTRDGWSELKCLEHYW